MDNADILVCASGDNVTIRPSVFNERDLRLDPTTCLQCGAECDETRAAPVALRFISALAACVQVSAPTDIGKCWRRVGVAATKPRFTVVADNVASLDDCAALLETFHLQGARTADGAYQGYFIFVDDKEIASSTQWDGFRYPIFQPSQRGEIDGDLRRLINERAGKPLTTSDVAVERK